jgi:hypothetical protein
MEKIQKENTDVKKTNRLTTNQKKIIELISEIDLFTGIDIPEELSLDNVDIKQLKYYNSIHDTINDLLKENNIEPHEIFSLIMMYNGNNDISKKIMSFITCRNICIIKKIYGSSSWEKNIEQIFKKFNKYFKNVTNKMIDQIVFELLIQNINLFDIAFCKVTLNSKNELKNINLLLDDQKYIVTKLIENGCKKQI